MKLLRKCIILSSTFICLTSIILWVLTTNINPETIKQLIAKQITALTHKKTHIDGAISWQLFPRPGIKFNQIKIGDETLNEDYAISIDNLLLNLKITPLLHGQFFFSEIDVEGVAVSINEDAPLSVKVDETPSNKTSESIKDDQFAIERLLINGEVLIKKEGKTTVFKNIQATIEQFNMQNKPFPLQLKARLTQTSFSPVSKANINFKGRISIPPTIIHDLGNSINRSVIEGQLLIQDVVFNQLTISKISASLKTNKSGFTFYPLTLSLYNGQSIGDMSYTHATNQLSINQTAMNLDAKRLMTAVLGHETLSGDLDYSIHATIPLGKPSVDHISGNGTITIKNGEIYKIDIDRTLITLKEKLHYLIDHRETNPSTVPELALSEQDKRNQGNTPFKLASVRFQVINRQLISDSLLLQTEQLHVKGDGSISLTTHQMNSQLQVAINTNNSDATMLTAQQILGGYFPVLLSGTMEHPIVLPDFKKINPLLRQFVVKKTLNKPLELIQGQLQRLIN